MVSVLQSVSENSSSPLIPWQTRADLVGFELGIDPRTGAQELAVKDAIQNEFFRFGPVEYCVLQTLRTPTTLSQMQTILKQRFGWQLGDQELMDYMQTLVRDNLLVTRRLGDGRRLLAQLESQRRSRQVQRWAGLLSIKFPGIHPGWLLRKLSPVGWLAFHPVTLVLLAIALLMTVAFVVLSWQSVWERVPDLASMLNPTHLVLMVIGFLVAKVIHELGHGLACQRVGHECTEMGVMLLVFLPCLYCEVSDVWTERNRWKRILVSLAGVLVELAIALVCFWGWYFALEETLSHFLFSMMVITSVNTLLVNGNPLMRYDGYYVLSDWLQIPNLAAESNRATGQTFRSWFVDQRPDFELGRRRRVLLGYGVAATVYRWLIMIAIGGGIWYFFESQQLTSIGQIAVGLIAILAALPIIMGILDLGRSATEHGLKLANLVVVIAAMSGLILCLTTIEFHHRVRGLADMQWSDPQQLFAPAAGRLIPEVDDGAQVDEGDLIATIVSDQLELDRIELSGQLQDINQRLGALELTQELSRDFADLEFWKKRQQSTQQRLNEVEKRILQLRLRAPTPGRFVSARRARPEMAPQAPELPVPEGPVMDRRNLGQHLIRGQRLGYVGNPTQTQGWLKVAESDIELVRVGAPVHVFLDHTDEFLEGAVTRISLESEQDLTNPGAAENNQDSPRRYYRVEFDFSSDPRIRPGSSRYVVILCDKTTTVGYLQRWWRNSFWF